MQTIITHPSKQASTCPEVEPTIAWSQVRRVTAVMLYQLFCLSSASKLHVRSHVLFVRSIACLPSLCWMYYFNVQTGFLLEKIPSSGVCWSCEARWQNPPLQSVAPGVHQKAWSAGTRWRHVTLFACYRKHRVGRRVCPSRTRITHEAVYDSYRRNLRKNIS